jgi:hypothetical protein
VAQNLQGGSVVAVGIGAQGIGEFGILAQAQRQRLLYQAVATSLVGSEQRVERIVAPHQLRGAERDLLARQRRFSSRELL